MGERNLYLSNTPVEEAVSLYLGALRDIVAVSYEKIPVTKALNRTTKSAVYAKYSSPLFNASAMDGIAVISSRTDGASETKPVDLLPSEDYKIVDTGDPVRPPFDAVIMAEDLIDMGGGKVRIIASAAAWDNIRPVGEDIVVGEMILPSNHHIRPIDIGVLLSAGILEIDVIKSPESPFSRQGLKLSNHPPCQKAGILLSQTHACLKIWLRLLAEPRTGFRLLRMTMKR